MHQYQLVLKSRSYYHSFHAASAQSVHPVPLLPGTSGCLAFDVNEVIKRTTTITLVTNHMCLRTSLEGKYRLYQSVSKWGVWSYETFQNLWAGDIFLENWPHCSVQRCWCTMCGCGAGFGRLWKGYVSLIMDVKSFCRDTPYRCWRLSNIWITSENNIFLELSPLSRWRGKQNLMIWFARAKKVVFLSGKDGVWVPDTWVEADVCCPCLSLLLWTLLSLWNHEVAKHIWKYS